MKLSVRVISSLCCFLFFFSASLVAQNAPLPFRTAIELALKNSATSGIARADAQRAQANYLQARNLFLPQVTLGSGLAYSNGFPLSLEGSAPSIVNVVAQSTVFNPAQRQFQNAAKTEWRAAELQDKDQRNAVIQDVAISYAELAKWEARLSRSQEDEVQAVQLEKAVVQRLQEGIDSAVDLNKAKLTAARARLAAACRRWPTRRRRLARTQSAASHAAPRAAERSAIGVRRRRSEV